MVTGVKLSTGIWVSSFLTEDNTFFSLTGPRLLFAPLGGVGYGEPLSHPGLRVSGSVLCGPFVNS